MSDRIRIDYGKISKIYAEYLANVSMRKCHCYGIIIYIRWIVSNYLINYHVMSTMSRRLVALCFHSSQYIVKLLWEHRADQLLVQSPLFLYSCMIQVAFSVCQPCEQFSVRPVGPACEHGRTESSRGGGWLQLPKSRAKAPFEIWKEPAIRLRYAYKYTDTFGTPKFEYSWKLVPTDIISAGKHRDLSLREKSQADTTGYCRRDRTPSARPIGKKMTVCQRYAKYIRQRGNVKRGTEKADSS